MTEFARILEGAGMFLTDAETAKAVACAELYVQLHVYMARKSLKEGKPRYKVRPRLHSFLCETILRLHRSKFNPKFAACWSDEDFIGQTCAISQRALHPATLGHRMLERLLMQLNAYLAGEG